MIGSLGDPLETWSRPPLPIPAAEPNPLRTTLGASWLSQQGPFDVEVAGAGSVEGLTADLAEARAVSEQVGRLLAARDEVAAQLSSDTER